MLPPPATGAGVPHSPTVVLMDNPVRRLHLSNDNREQKKDTMRIIELQQEYLRYLATQRGCSRSTLRTYASAFKRCLSASAAVGVNDPDTEQLDRRWANRIVQELGSQLRPRTVHRNITAWRAMLAYARDQGYTTADPFAGVRLPKKDPVRRESVTTEDIQALLTATTKLLNRTRATMMRALLLTAATAATRYSDLMPLKVTDLDLGAGTLTVRCGKGGKGRTLPVPMQACEALQEWLQVRSAWLATRPATPGIPWREPEALWLADRGRPFGEGGLRKALRELCLIAGISRPIALHDIRHSAATRMARQGMPIVGIQAVLGHSNLTTTQGYIAGAGPHLQEWAERMALPDPKSVEKADAEPQAKPERPRRLRRFPRGGR